MPTIRLILADDHPIYREGLCALLENDSLISVVGQASNGMEVLELLKSTEADIALLDLDMQPLDGLETVVQLREKGIPIKTIILTLHNDTQLMRRLITEGVNGFLLKDSNASEVIQAVHAVYQGDNYLSTSVSGALMQDIKNAGTTSSITEKLAALTEAEIRILRKVATDRTSKEIADELNLSTRTVENHRARICKKLDLSGVHSLVKFAFEHRDKM